MAGGPSTPALAIAVGEAGGLGFLAAGYKRAPAVRDDIRAVRAGTSAPFGVNLFVPAAAPGDPETVRTYVERLAPEARRQGAELGEPRFDDDDWEAKLDVISEERPAVASFTFGWPGASIVDRLHARDVAVWVTVTNVEEAVVAAEVSADVLIVQGAEAGGHRGGFVEDGSDEGGIGLLALLRLLARATPRPLPLVASGGVADGAALAAVLCAGASAAQIGTALMLAPEAGTPEAQRAVLAERRPTRITRAFTGRAARGIVNRFIEEHSGAAPVAYPEIHHVTSPLRAAARHAGDAEAFNLWAGQAHELVHARPAGEIVREMAAEAAAALDRVSAALRDPNTSAGRR
jgi:nitronate monooxygenase